MATYRVELRTLSVAGFTQQVSDLALSSFSCSWVLNGAGAFDGEVALAAADSDIKNVGARELIVYRDSTPIWGGYLQNIDVDRPGDRVRIGGVGYWERARMRYVRSNTIATDLAAHTLAWNLLSASQGLTSGSLGWTQGSNSSSGSVSRELCADSLPNVGTTIEGLANEGYFDFAVDVAASPSAGSVAVFKTWSSRGSDKAATIQFTSANTMTLSYSKSADGLATYVDAFGVDQCFPPHVEANANMSTYGRLEAQPTDVRTGSLTEVTSAVNEYLAANKIPAWAADLTYLESAGPSWTSYDVGDTVRISPGDALATSFDLRVIERELSVDSNSTAMVSLTCEERA